VIPVLFENFGRNRKNGNTGTGVGFGSVDEYPTSAIHADADVALGEFLDIYVCKAGVTTKDKNVSDKV